MAATNPGPAGSTSPVTSVNTADLTPTAVKPPSSPSPSPSSSSGPSLESAGIGEPKGTDNSEELKSNQGENADPTMGTGVDGELVVWEARYSKRNFIGRITLRVALAIGWAVLAVYTWGKGHDNLAPLTWIALVVVVALWLGMIYRMIQAHYSHYYRLTNRRLFVSTGLFNRRRDMMELLRVKDVFTRQQSLSERWLGLGTVVVVPTEKELPTFYIAGVDDPKQVMDLIWHHARSERDHRSVKIDSV